MSEANKKTFSFSFTTPGIAEGNLPPRLLKTRELQRLVVLFFYVICIQFAYAFSLYCILNK
jgi:hypothetical protein